MATKVGSINAPLVTGNVPYTSVGFQPQALIGYAVGEASFADYDNQVYEVCTGFTDGTNAHSISQAHVQNMGQDTSFVRLTDTNGVIILEGEIVSFDTDGFTINWTTVSGATAYTVMFVALGGALITNVAVGNFEISGSGNTSVTGVGFEPDVIMFLHADITTIPLIETVTSRCWGIGFDDGTDTAGICYRQRVSIIGVRAPSILKKDHALNLMGPKNFGLDIEYQPF